MFIKGYHINDLFLLLIELLFSLLLCILFGISLGIVYLLLCLYFLFSCNSHIIDSCYLRSLQGGHYIEYRYNVIKHCYQCRFRYDIVWYNLDGELNDLLSSDYASCSHIFHVHSRICDLLLLLDEYIKISKIKK